MALAIIGGRPDAFAPLADLHRRAVAEAGHRPVPIAVHAHGYVAASTERAVEEYYPSYAHAMSVIGRERGWGPMTRPAFDAMRSRTGSLVLGDPDAVAAKIVAMRDVLGIERFMLHISVGTLPHEQVLESIRLLGTEVAPRVRNAAPGSVD
jgi:alkanesulfonate monooxygenase SsuD/methylene tetrahydromethanopterin reductase-like flavin-dependent oxidoreductase (luciferase family)